MTADYALLPDNHCDPTGYPSDAEMLADMEMVKRSEQSTERDRIWQSFLRLKSTRLASVADVTELCRWWFLAGVVEDLRRERRRRLR